MGDIMAPVIKLSQYRSQAIDPTNVFDLYHEQFKKYIDAEPHYLVACTLWALHTHIYNKFSRSPRLVIVSPVENCGKSQVLDTINQLAANTEVITSITSATLYNLADMGATLLLEEFDNVNKTRDLQSILNDGYQFGRHIWRKDPETGVRRKYNIYTPVAIATNLKENGHLPVPSTLMTRSVVIRIKRALPNVKIPEIDELDIQMKLEFDAVRQKAVEWFERIKLNPTPIIPPEMTNRRTASFWRILFAIADALDRGGIAREAAIKIIGQRQENIKILLLIDIQTIFNDCERKSLSSDGIVNRLIEMAGDGNSEYDWTSFQNRALTKGKMSRMLSDFEIKSHVIRVSATKTARGFDKKDFEDAWNRYC
jgi:hypothetical protein